MASQLNVDKEKLKKSLYLQETGEKNSGSSIVQDIKWHIKLSRHNSIHVSPTVVFNGLIDNDVSSGWELDNWMNYFKNKGI